jgi:hypothetical protein
MEAEIMATVHVYPVEDVREHLVNGEGYCWCCPVYDMNDIGERVCIHNKFDYECPPTLGDVIH